MAQPATYQKIKERLGSQKWRLNNLYYIRNKEGKLVKLKFNWGQQQFCDNMHYCNIILKARQLGFSTFYSIYMLDAALFNSNHKCGIIDAGIDDAKKKLKMMKLAYDKLPVWLQEQIPMTIRAAEMIEFNNGSGITVGTSHRGDTLQKLLISEYGKISAKTPDKAKEIKTGALNAVAAGQQICIESTAEGKKGEFYEMCQTAIKLAQTGKNLSRLEYKFHFFPWYNNPEYSLTDAETANVVVPASLIEYLNQFDLTPNQRAWYAIKASVMGEDMRQEYPSTPDEAFEGSAEGAFYSKEMAHVRKSGQLGYVPYDAAHPVYTFWDLGGAADFMSVWFYQVIDGKERFIDYHESNNNGWAFYASMLNQKGYNYIKHFLPHDANTRIVGKEITSAKTMAEQAGIRPIEVVPRTKSVYGDVMNHCKPALMNCWFDESNTDQGVLHLDNYSRRWDRNNAIWLKDAEHNEASHGADAFRTYAMAKHLKMLEVKSTKIDMSGMNRGRGGSSWAY